jgi:hypothetical protein
MQEHTDSIKRPNLRMIGIEEGEEVQAKGMCNIVNKIITENFPNLEKTKPILIQEAIRTPNRLDQNRTIPRNISIKTTGTENRERILKAVREKKQITNKGKPIKITADFSKETNKARRTWSEGFRALNENNINTRILYAEKLSFKIDGAIKVFCDKQTLKQYMTTKPPLQKFYKEFCTQKVKANKTMKGQAIPNHKRRKGKKVKSNVDSARHNQTLKQQRKLNDRNHNIPINTNLKH